MEKQEKKLTKAQVKDLSKRLNDEVLKFQKALIKLEKDVNMMQKVMGLLMIRLQLVMRWRLLRAFS